MKWFLIFVIPAYSIYAGVLLMNDTSFLLTAIIQSASGQLLNQINIQPGEQNNWTRDLEPTNLDVPGAPEVSITPYMVIWRCPHGGDFSICYNVSPGQLIKASQCPGAHYCKPKEKEKECPACICPPYPEQEEDKSK